MPNYSKKQCSFSFYLPKVRVATANFIQPSTPVQGGHNLPPLVEIGLRWLPKLGKDQSLASLAAVAALKGTAQAKNIAKKTIEV